MYPVARTPFGAITCCCTSCSAHRSPVILACRFQHGIRLHGCPTLRASFCPAADGYCE
ncbi:hypothetical protein PR003_g22202 [Phytophthora rubi]|uniref:Uncharacterized protein n=1 Tax=Phytophthora rubi TaxID=129364 RepID=A0A6A4DBM3_9STRA|nr:hypothetical protein PR001_g16407 [Phytophthora rubi]KAE9034110.1 hypothetical protein PR002_g8317 [Phytophthora rubi]KAE9302643.1 hypothetical protein PR003_g22202 [Phytophthora rubi]